ncbi:MAG: radical SAM protein [Nanoarchaeota archaeon]
MVLKVENILERFPLRVSITDNCNLACFFCSNEGLGDSRNQVSIAPDDFRYLVGTLRNYGLEHLSLSGGDPTAHPKALEIVQIANQSGVPNRFYHTNGILLAKDGLADALGEFTKVGVSLHNTDPQRYAQITGGRASQYEKAIDGLRALAEKGLAKKVEVKHVTVKGMNDDLESLRGTLDLCAQYGFKFKFLNFEAIHSNQVPLVQDVRVIKQRVEALGAISVPERGSTFRGQTDYLPVSWYSYKGTNGVVIDVGCGRPEVCRSCHDSNEIYVTPRLGIKACKMSDHEIPLKEAIERKDSESILDAVLESRRFLESQPGLGKNHWGQR